MLMKVRTRWPCASMRPLPSAVNYAAGLAYVLAPTDHRNLEMLDGDSVGGSTNLGRDATLTTAGYTGQADTSLSFSFGESIDEPDDSYSRNGAGTVVFSLYESGSDFSQPDSSITLSDSEWATRYETDGTPLKVGTSTEFDSTNFTLTESGAAAVYSWTASGVTTAARSEDETVPDGTYTATDNESATMIANGVTDCSGGTFNETWSGTPTSSRVEIGYHGPESYTLVHRENSGTLSGSETGGYGSYAFSLTETHFGTETAIDTESDPGGGGSETRIENHTDTLSASGNDFGDISVAAGRGSTYSLLGSDTLDGVVTNVAGGGTDSNSATTTGSQVAGGFTLVHGASEGGSATATTTNQGVLSTETTTSTDSDSATEYGTAGSGDTRSSTYRATRWGRQAPRSTKASPRPGAATKRIRRMPPAPATARAGRTRCSRRIPAHPPRRAHPRTRRRRRPPMELLEPTL